MKELAAGEIVDGRYVIKREIARGAMGVVSEAVHGKLGRRVALKTLTPQAADWTSGIARLMREGRLLTVCNHPHVPIVYDAGECVRFGPYLALEMIEGRSLDGLLAARGRLDVAAMARVGALLAAAIRHVHELGILHRDIKPANVIVRKSSKDESAHLIDFGLASVADGAPLVETRLTAAGEMLGTVAFMSPELLLQEAGASFASDVYALGALLYECLTGQLPFPGGPMAIISAHVARGKAPPMTTLRPEIPRELDEAVTRAIARDPAARISLAELEKACNALGARGRAPSLLEPETMSGDASKRHFPRVPYSAPARLVTAAGTIDGRTEDISEGGVLIVIATGECMEGERVTVRFPLPGTGRVIVAGGIARWMKVQRGRRAIGIGFHALAEDVAKEIRTYTQMMSEPSVRDSMATSTLWTAASP